jgi:hypothetical protein
MCAAPDHAASEGGGRVWFDDASEPQPPDPGDPIWYGSDGWDPYMDDPWEPVPDRIVVADALRQLSEAPGSVAAGLQTLAQFASLDRLGPTTFGPDGPRLSGADLVYAVQAAHRLVGWAQAQEQRLTAAVARPGVAVPVCDVLETVMSGTTPIIPDPEGVQPSDADLADPTRGYRETRVCGTAEWDLAVVETAASLAEPELSAALRLATITARTRIGAALDMVDGVPATLAAVEAGRIDPYAGRLIADATACLDNADLRAEAERQILALADGRTPGDIGRIAADVVIQIDPDAAEQRAAQARARRGTGVRSLQDDLARFYADLACEDAVLAHQILDRLAGALPREARAGRGTNAIRADIFADMFTQLATVGHIDLRPEQPDVANGEPKTPSHGDDAVTTDEAPDATTDRTEPPGAIDPPGAPHGVVDPERIRRGGLLSQLRLPDPLRVNLDLTVGLSTLAGLDDLPATLAGYGAITAQLARALSRAGGSVRLRVVDDGPPDGDDRPPDVEPPPTGNRNPADNNGGRHRGGPDCGGPLDLGRSSYRPTAALERAVNGRDRRCRFLGCAMPAVRCDKDHAITWDSGGASCPCNLDCLCRFHHRVKTFTRWRAERRAGNTVSWTSPLGSRYEDKPLPDRTVYQARSDVPAAPRPSDPSAPPGRPGPSDRPVSAAGPTPPNTPTAESGSGDGQPPF